MECEDTQSSSSHRGLVNSYRPQKAMALFCCKSDLSDEYKVAADRSKQIDKQLKKYQKDDKNEIKILLLGAGESGKSTFLTQMKIISGEEFTAEQETEFRTIIYGNIIKGMRVLVDARDKLGLGWGDPANAAHGRLIMCYENDVSLEPQLFKQYVRSVRELWRDDGIRRAFERRDEFHLTDSIAYFLDEIDRIGTLDYKPSHQDILYSRKATRGIHVYDTTINDKPFRFMDVGGQRSQRQKWLQCFDQVTAILFLVSSNEFDQLVWEDNTTNRLIESCTIFDTIINNRSFIDNGISIILFLNKTDLLEEKIKRSNIENYFPDFKGDSKSLKDVQFYIQRMFEERQRDKNRALYSHFTTAVDTKNIETIFTAVKDIIMEKEFEGVVPQ